MGTRLESWVEEHWRDHEIPAWALSQLKEIAQEEAKEMQDLRDRLASCEDKE